MTSRQIRLLKKDLLGWAFCLVPIVIFIVFIVVPLVMAFYISLTDYNLLRMEFVGFKNYVDIFSTPSIRRSFFMSFVNVLVYTAMSLPISLVVNVGIAALLQNNLRGAKVYRVLYYLPALTGSVAMAMIWSWFFHAAYSPINALLNLIGLPSIPFLESRWTAMPTLVFMTVWSGVGGGVVMYSAAMQTIPGEYYEAAKMDGASNLRQFFTITVPMLMPTIFFTTTMGIIGSLQLFDPVYLLTNGGPEGTTETPAWKIYMVSFETANEAGQGSAMAVCLFFVVMIVTVVFQKITKEQVV